MRQRKDDRRHLSFAFGPCLDPLWQHRQLLPLHLCVPALECRWSRGLHRIFFCSTTYQFVNVTRGPYLALLVILSKFPQGLSVRRRCPPLVIVRLDSTHHSQSLSIMCTSATYTKIRATPSRPLFNTRHGGDAITCFRTRHSTPASRLLS